MRILGEISNEFFTLKYQLDPICYKKPLSILNHYISVIKNSLTKKIILTLVTISRVYYKMIYIM